MKFGPFYKLGIFSILLLLAATSAAQPIIRKIDIIRLNVFDNNLKAKSNVIYRLGNKFHAVTRERIIRQEMLIEPYHDSIRPLSR
jgi:hypothetical protein